MRKTSAAEFGPCAHVARIRSLAVVAENGDGGAIQLSVEEWAVKQYCCQVDMISNSSIHGLASWLLYSYLLCKKRAQLAVLGARC